jgi:Domain of unknown function (DUF4304)
LEGNELPGRADLGLISERSVSKPERFGLVPTSAVTPFIRTCALVESRKPEMIGLIYACGLRLLTSDKMKNDSMIAALKAEFVPALKERGFKGSFPHFRRITPDKIDLLTVQFDKWGGGFVIEIAKCGPEGITTSWGSHIPPNKVSAWDVDAPRPRLGSPAPDGTWFRYDDGTPVE